MQNENALVSGSGINLSGYSGPDAHAEHGWQNATGPRQSAKRRCRHSDVTRLQPPNVTRGPGGRIFATTLDESGFTPEQKYIANEILNGRMSPAALQTRTSTPSPDVPLVGAGMTPGRYPHALGRNAAQRPVRRVNVTGVHWRRWILTITGRLGLRRGRRQSGGHGEPGRSGARCGGGQRRLRQSRQDAEGHGGLRYLCRAKHRPG